MLAPNPSENEHNREIQLTRLLKNYSNARQSWEAWCFFVNFNCKIKDAGIVQRVDNHQLFFHLRYLTLKDFHIEAYKIVKKSNQNNADNIFSLLKTTAEIHPGKKNAVDVCLGALDKHQETIAEICAIRDKYYAHLDKDYEKYLITHTALADIHEVFIAIEKAIAVVASPEILQTCLEQIPSRNDLCF